MHAISQDLYGFWVLCLLFTKVAFVRSALYCYYSKIVLNKQNSLDDLSLYLVKEWL